MFILYTYNRIWIQNFLEMLNQDPDPYKRPIRNSEGHSDWSIEALRGGLTGNLDPAGRGKSCLPESVMRAVGAHIGNGNFRLPFVPKHYNIWHEVKGCNLEVPSSSCTWTGTERFWKAQIRNCNVILRIFPLCLRIFPLFLRYNQNSNPPYLCNALFTTEETCSDGKNSLNSKTVLFQSYTG